MYLTFKQHFPTWEDFRNFVMDYSVYYNRDEYTDNKVLVYYTLLYRQYANSRAAYESEIFYEQLSLLIAENFREFFLIRGVLDFIASKSVSDMLLGIETITNTATNPNMPTDKDTIINYIGTQVRQRSQENVIDRAVAVIKGLRIREVTIEVDKYKDLFMKIIPREDWFYVEENKDED